MNDNPSVNEQASSGNSEDWTEQEIQDMQQKYLEEVWQLPVDERRIRAIRRQSVQRRWDSEAGVFYSDEEHQRRVQETMELYKAV